MELAVTGLGMVTSVGYDARTACGSIRSGITRPQEIPSFVLLDVETCEESFLVGHPIEGYCEGFSIAAGWLRLALGCLDDLTISAALPGPEDRTFWERTGLLAVTPGLLIERFGVGADDPDDLRKAYLERLLELWDRPIGTASTALVAGGNTGAVVALERARAAIASDVADRVIVLGADSYLDDLSLTYLGQASRLKTTENPAGLAPGQGAASLLIESLAVAQRRGAGVEALVGGVASERETRAFGIGELSQGEALARAIRRCLMEAGGSLPFEGDLVSDLSGEPWRAHELATASVRVAGLLDHVRWVYPAVSLGDTGAASGAIGIGVAARSLSRGYARSRQALVVTSSEDGLVGAVKVISSAQGG